jgi:hypothetical protein
MREKGMISLLASPHRGVSKIQVSLHWRRKPRDKGNRRS